MTGDVQLPGAASPVQLPDMIDPEAPYLEFRANQCKECGEVGPLALVQNPAWHEWFTQHSDATGHTKFYEYKMQRSSGAITSVGTRGRR